MARQKGLEPLTYCLEGSCSIQLSYWRISETMERVTGIEPASPAWKAGALAIVLHPHAPSVEIVSFVMIAYHLPYVKKKIIFCQDFSRYLICARKWWKMGAASTASFRRSAPHCRSGCHCTPQMGSVL